jgi:hypothetical protein
VALSTVEAEYIALCVAVREAVWLRKLLADLFGHELDSTVIHCDNQSCVKLYENLVFQDKSKHIEIKYHYIRDMVQRKAVHMQYLSTHEQVAASSNRLPGRSLSTSVRDLAWWRMPP